ncbi:MAG: PAS domain-containing protein [Magnetococcales bacterium]|nr:PAS domain-containing protein [Magnetococcales bacterium]
MSTRPSLFAIFCCETFAPDLSAAVAAEGWTDVTVLAYPVRCGRPPIQWTELTPCLPATSTGAVILGRACLKEIGSPPAGWPQTTIAIQEECFDLVADHALVRESISRGAYLMTPGWLEQWRHHLQTMGFAGHNARTFFQECARELLLLDTGIRSDAPVWLAELAAEVGVPANRLTIGLDHTRLLLLRLVAEWRLTEERATTKRRERQHDRAMADMIGAMDFLGRLALLRKEEEALEGMEQMFRMLFAPELFRVVRVDNGIPCADPTLSDALQTAVNRLSGASWAWTPSGHGFVLRLGPEEQTVGILVVERLAFPEFRERYLGLALNLTGVCGLILQNSRTLQRMRNAENATKQANAELDRFFSMSLDLLCIADMDGHFLRMNRSWETALGYPLAELTNRRFLDFVHPDDMAATLAAMDDLSSGQEVLNFINRYRCRDGSYRWIEWRSAPWRNQLVYAAARDITERRGMEEALHASEEKFRQMFQNMSSGVVVYGAVDEGADFMFLDINASVERIEQVQRTQLVGQRLKNVFPGVEAFGLLEVLRRVWSSGEPEHFPIQFYTDHRICGWRENFVYRLSSGEVVVIYDDITQRKQHEIRLQEVNQELQDFAYVASHDLQEPLRTINSYVGFLREDIGGEENLSPDAQEDMRHITLAAERMVTLIQDLLSYSRSGRLELCNQAVSLNNCLHVALENLRIGIEESGARIEQDDLPMVTGDAPSLTRVLQNLIGNALKFRATGSPCIVRVTSEPAGDRWLIRVIDNGIGMEERHVGQIFQPFKRLHGRKAYPGTGLGLAIVRKIVEIHGGSVQVSSVLGEGSTFTVHLSAWNAAAAEDEPSGNAPDTEKKR